MPPVTLDPAGSHDPVPFGCTHTATIPAGTELVRRSFDNLSVASEPA